METSSKTCRCCMKSESMGMVNILESSFDGLQLNITYFNCTGIQISAKEPFPLDVCNFCESQLQNFHVFREQCIKSDRLYRGQSMFMKREPVMENDDVETKMESIYVNMVEPSWQVKEDDTSFKTVESIKNEVEDPEDESFNDESSESSGEDYTNVDAGNSKKTKKKIERKKKSDKSKRKTPSVKQECFTCSVGDCSKRFYVKRRYEGHVRQHQGLKPAVCTYCSKQFSKWISLDQHVDAEHSNRAPDIKCDYPNCEKTFTTMIYKKRHVKSAHMLRPKPPTELAFICHECGKSFVALSRLKEHLFTHLPNLEKPHKCQKCGKGFIKKHKLKNHMMRHEGIKNFVCPHCGMRKTTKEELKTHINCHTREKTYTCTHCDKVFSKYENVKRHIRVVHEGIRAFHCTYCDQSFGKAETLKHHIMTHTGEKPHKCNVCDRGFIQQTALKTHMATHLR